jgi:CheY-like chemotaxis protein
VLRRRKWLQARFSQARAMQAMSEALSDKEILVIDDEPAVIDVIRRFLLRNGYRVRSAPGGRIGLREVENRSPDLVILDMIMPDIGGIDFLNRLAQEHIEVPIIATSGKPFGKEFLRTAQSLGAVSVLTKPFSEKQLITLVREALSPGDEG